ncbi:2OG-Fe(II) oxygenase [Lacibacter sp. H375]|uniref:2OG-Fe(II) oxygenase n=1 Tax=Lacibacter sp. H375 TaxID=3133424 RepID=UPI0030BAE36D
MEKIFNTLVNSFINNKVGIAENFLSKTLSLQLKANLQTLYTSQQMQSAGTGGNSNVHYDQLFRSDIIYWLDRTHNNAHENTFFDLMDSFILFLNETCYTGITGYEFHYALYEQGSFYKKHLDQFKNDDSRKYSMIMYLNSEWTEGDGGELCIHHHDHIENITPTSGKTVFFKSSELEHEVLLSNKPRMSITGWLKG